MLLIPAIDIKDGQCVRLSQGEMDAATVYAEDPVVMADRWVAAGARRLHIVDLDGAGQGRPCHMDIISTIIKRHPGIPVQVGGGVRDEDTIRAYLHIGATYLIIGTRAITTPDFVIAMGALFPQRIIVGLDVKEGKLATHGWSKQSSYNAAAQVQRFKDAGIAAVVLTDISRDGMLNHINIEATVALCEDTALPVIASGGLRDLDDVAALCKVAKVGIDGVITGRAIYEGTLDLTAAQQLADELCPSNESH